LINTPHHVLGVGMRRIPLQVLDVLKNPNGFASHGLKAGCSGCRLMRHHLAPTGAFPRRRGRDARRRKSILVLGVTAAAVMLTQTRIALAVRAGSGGSEWLIPQIRRK
jgi:hypothetical protein